MIFEKEQRKSQAPDFGHIGQIARRKLGLDWCVISWEKLDDDSSSIVKLAPRRIMQSGPRKGKLVFITNEKKTTVVTDEEISVERRNFEKSGKCGTCYGDGWLFARWSKEEGYSYRDCYMCAGSGLVSHLTSESKAAET